MLINQLVDFHSPQTVTITVVGSIRDEKMQFVLASFFRCIRHAQYF